MHFALMLGLNGWKGTSAICSGLAAPNIDALKDS